MDLDVDMEQKYTIYSIPQQDQVYIYQATLKQHLGLNS